MSKGMNRKDFDKLKREVAAMAKKFNIPSPILCTIDQAPKRTTWKNHVIEYRITVYHNILGGFVSYCN